MNSQYESRHYNSNSQAKRSHGEMEYYREMMAGAEREADGKGMMNINLNMNKNKNLPSEIASYNNHDSDPYPPLDSPIASQVSSVTSDNFRLHKLEALEKNIHQMSEQLKQNLCQKDERLVKLEQDREFLLQKNQELAKEINRLDSLMNVNMNMNMNTYSKTIGVSNTNMDTVPTNDFTQQSIYSEYSSTKGLKNEAGHRRVTSNEKKISLKKTITPSRSSTPKPKTKKQSNENSQIPKYSKNNTCISNRSILEENDRLKLIIGELEHKIKTINDSFALDNLEKKGKDHLRVELEIWKNRSEAIGKNYIDTISGLKKEIFQDKMNYIEQIKSTQSLFTNQIIKLKTAYQSTVEIQEKKIKQLEKENDDLKKKVNKVKEIFMPMRK